MTGVLDQIVGLARLSLQDPRAGARGVLALGVPLPARTAGLLLMAVTSALLMHIGFALLPMPDDPLAQFMQQSPIRTAALQWIILAASVLLIYRIGRAWGGHGNLPDTLLIVVWLQVIMLAVQIVQLLALVIAQPISDGLSLAGLVLFFWLMTGFIAELHGFKSRWAVFAGFIAGSFAVAVVFVLILMMIYGPEAFRSV